MKYRLNKAETVPVVLNNVAKTKQLTNKSIVTYSNIIRLEPGKVYQSDDEAMLNWFRNYKQKVRHSESLERLLKSNNVPYTIEFCKSCGGRIKKIYYQLVEVFE